LRSACHPQRPVIFNLEIPVINQHQHGALQEVEVALVQFQVTSTVLTCCTRSPGNNLTQCSHTRSSDEQKWLRKQQKSSSAATLTGSSSAGSSLVSVMQPVSHDCTWLPALKRYKQAVQARNVIVA